MALSATVSRLSKLSRNKVSKGLLTRISLVLALLVVSALVARHIVLASISLSTTTAATQNFDGMGTPATGSTASNLPTDFRADKLSAVRTVGTFTAAGTTVGLAGGAGLSS